MQGHKIHPAHKFEIRHIYKISRNASRIYSDYGTKFTSIDAHGGHEVWYHSSSADGYGSDGELVYYLDTEVDLIDAHFPD